MTMKKVWEEAKQTLNSWSFSKLIVFEECKYRAKLQWLDKIPDLQPKTAADRGTQIHQEAEDYVLGKSGLTHNLRHFEDDFAALAQHAKSGRVICEQEWGFDDQWNPTEWRRAWLRLKADAVCHLDATHAVVVDYKGLERTTPIPTPTGWTTMGDIRLGDELFAQDGSVCQVTGKSQVKNLPCFEIVFDDTTKVRCDNEHLWTLADGSVVPVTALKKHDHIAVAKPLQLPEANLPIDPYVFGLWLADGKHTSAEITKPDSFIWEEIVRCGYEISHDYSERAKDNKCRVHTVKGIRGLLVKLNVLGNKHIPQIYMRASFEQRLALLQGIMDGDGSVNPLRKQVVLQSVDPDLSKQYLELILSLGQRATRAFTLGKGFGKYVIAYPISFRPNGINPFRLPRKANACKDFGPGRSATRRIVSIEEIPSVETQCIAVDSADHTFLCTDRFLPTHNTGKRFGNEIKHARQLQLYAVCALILYPELERVTCELWYLDQNELADFTMKRSQLKKYLKIFDKAGIEFTTESEFKPNPNIYSCKYCPYHPSKQGDCTFGAVTEARVNTPTSDFSNLKPVSFDMDEFKGRV